MNNHNIRMNGYVYACLINALQSIERASNTSAVTEKTGADFFELKRQLKQLIKKFEVEE